MAISQGLGGKIQEYQLGCMGAERHQCRIQKAALSSICAHPQHSSGSETLSLVFLKCLADFSVQQCPLYQRSYNGRELCQTQLQAVRMPALCVLYGVIQLSRASMVKPLQSLFLAGSCACRRMTFCPQGQCATAIWWSVSGRRTRQKPRSSGRGLICSCQWRPPAAFVTSEWAPAAVPPG